MKGYIIDRSGTETELPELLSWDICHGMGEPCDWFELSFIYYPHQLDMLRSACRFKGTHGEETVFTGIVDEYSISIDDNGSVATLSGRSRAALLLDNELPARYYDALSSDGLISNIVSPYGVAASPVKSAKTLYAFTVRTGESAWSAVRRFCRYAWGSVPYFTRGGVLVLDSAPGSSIEINAAVDAASVSLCDERYGIISDVTVRNRVTGASFTRENAPFKSRGGSCHREISVPKTTGADAARYTAEYQIAESQRGKRRIKITITQQFAAFPGDTVTLTAEKLGVSGKFSVISSHCWADSMSAGTILTLEV